MAAKQVVGQVMLVAFPVRAVLKLALSRGAAMEAVQVHVGNTGIQVCVHGLEVWAVRLPIFQLQQCIRDWHLLTVNSSRKSLEKSEAVPSVKIMAQEYHLAIGICLKELHQQFLKSISTNQQKNWMLLEHSNEWFAVHLENNI